MARDNTPDAKNSSNQAQPARFTMRKRRFAYDYSNPSNLYKALTRTLFGRGRILWGKSGSVKGFLCIGKTRPGREWRLRLTPVKLDQRPVLYLGDRAARVTPLILVKEDKNASYC